MAYLSVNEPTLQKITQGDQTAFAELYQFYRAPALKFCTSIVKEEEEAENLLHEVFIKIWDRRTQINPELNFTSYLFTCLRNLAFDHLKKVEKNQLLREQYLECMETAREEESDVYEVRIPVLQAAVDSLSVKRRQILMMSIEQGKSYQEIAKLLNISKNTVKNQLVRAKQILREKVAWVN